nr:hypothetical protein [Actinopolyspora mortivallis]
MDTAIRQEIANLSEIVGISCLADGADSLFARAVLDHGGELVVIVPAAQYREGLPEDHHSVYDALLARASEVVRLSHVESTSQAHMEASLEMLSRADRLLAVWDGKPARGFGGTADIVKAAEERELHTTVIWPQGARRD